MRLIITFGRALSSGLAALGKLTPNRFSWYEHCLTFGRFFACVFVKVKKMTFFVSFYCAICEASQSRIISQERLNSNVFRESGKNGTFVSNVFIIGVLPWIWEEMLPFGRIRLHFPPRTPSSHAAETKPGNRPVQHTPRRQNILPQTIRPPSPPPSRRYLTYIWQISLIESRQVAYIWHASPETAGRDVGIPTIILAISAKECHT